MTELVRQLGALGVFLLMVPESACIPVGSPPASAKNLIES
jgi:hypothetical protein